ncbi:regulator of G protein signaling superfamily [Basidiobolus meristosporus CBS 931.73]|uniref:Regulator of G protein signaling superfamily n=1 Tax=Basidiobolus meristosporus CBS 931.73 TaxID=1314790 RepID=A0A1Y1WE74_9FUNG|nr:regulator of G protein signaling superfamily [Basidiobolus meristosporus CBS 931.73]|eukprot:ORX71762.1 regulator of G protein signaling superfamily [Basidiobolus meristosporus CBS 931.73]
MDNWTTSQKFYYPVTIGWNFFLISTTFLFISQYQSPAIRYRSITLSVFMVIGNSLVTTLYLGREPTYDSFPCFVNIWVSSIGMPLWLTSVAGRFMRLAFLYHFSQAKLVAGSSADHYVDLGSEKPTITSAPTMVLDENWYYKHREKFTTNYIVRLIIGALSFQMALTLLVQAFTTKFQITPTMALGNCLVGWEFIPVYLTSAFYVFVLCPLFITWLRGVDDAYGIKRELMADFTLGVIAFILYILFAALPSLRDVIKIFPAAHWSVVALMISHCFSIVLPAVNALRGGAGGSRSSSMASFESMVEDPQQFEVFKRFSLRDFSVENALFFERIQKLRHKTRELSGAAELPTWVILEINSIYNTFISADSEFELNLEASAVREIRRRFQSNDIRLDIFDRAFSEVRTLMFRYTYPRFVKMGQKSLAETMI